MSSERPEHSMDGWCCGCGPLGSLVARIEEDETRRTKRGYLVIIIIAKPSRSAARADGESIVRPCSALRTSPARTGRTTGWTAAASTKPQPRVANCPPRATRSAAARARTGATSAAVEEAATGRVVRKSGLLHASPHMCAPGTIHLRRAQ